MRQFNGQGFYSRKYNKFFNSYENFEKFDRVATRTRLYHKHKKKDGKVYRNEYYENFK